MNINIHTIVYTSYKFNEIEFLNSWSSPRDWPWWGKIMYRSFAFATGCKVTYPRVKATATESDRLTFMRGITTCDSSIYSCFPLVDATLTAFTTTALEQESLCHIVYSAAAHAIIIHTLSNVYVKIESRSYNSRTP